LSVQIVTPHCTQVRNRSEWSDWRKNDKNDFQSSPRPSLGSVGWHVDAKSFKGSHSALRLPFGAGCQEKHLIAELLTENSVLKAE
jgi:hypothetical protein